MEKTKVAIDVEFVKELRDFLEKIRRPKITIDFYTLVNTVDNDGEITFQLGERAIDLIKSQGIVADNMLDKLGEETKLF